MTVFIHSLIGPILVVFALSMLFNKKFYLTIYNELEKSQHYLLVVAMINLLLGILIIQHHNLWTGPAEIVASLFGWLALLKGLHVALAPHSFLKMAKSFVSPTSMVYLPVLLLALGGYMTWVGYFMS